MTALSNSLILSKPRSPSLHFSSGNLFNFLLFWFSFVDLIVLFVCLFLYWFTLLSELFISYWRIVEWLCICFCFSFLDLVGLAFIFLLSELMICVCRAPYYTQIGVECVYSLLIWLYYLVLMLSFTDLIYLSF